MKLAAAAALLGVASAYSVNCVSNFYGVKANGNHGHCRSYRSIANGCCMTNGGRTLQAYTMPRKSCENIGGHRCTVRVRQCGNHKGYTWHKVRRYCKLNSLRWNRAPGAAHNIAYGNRNIWVIGTNVEGGGYGIYKWTGRTWVKIPGSAIRAAVDRRGNGWVVNKFGGIYGYTGSRWVRVGGAAWDIDVGTGNKLWVIGTNVEGGGYGIYRWDGRWTKIPGSAVRIAVDGYGNGWVVNKFRRIFRYWGNRWWVLNGLATDISAHDGNVGVVGTDRAIWRREHVRSTWTKTNARGVKSVAMGPGNLIAGTATNTAIWAGH